ncbi:MAG: hypothetical protein A3F16_07060 [Deltaproteobacteria bacterium RIFCSPHIGHO2_12_FULL_43_9]|nr:MAG: hypothetical protein A3F16_07060 [Deltaproteobacteria bacterium RIFCSPHIGHO2_12_FULL_43_9]
MRTKILFFILVLLTTTYAFADEPGREPYYAPRRPASIPEPPPPPKPFTAYQARELLPPPPPPTVIAPAAVETDYDFFSVFGEALLWTVTEDGLGYAVACPGVPLGVARSTIINGCDTEDLRPNWQGGFRVGAAYTWSPDMWDLRARWTWYKDDDTDSVLGGTIYPTWTHPDQAIATGADVNAVATWHMEFNAVDLEMGKSFKPGTSFKLRPFGGLKGAILDQDFDAKYQNSTAVASTLNNHVIMNNDFGGIGFRGGLDAGWDLNWYGLSLFAKASGSILWGQFKTHYLSRRDANTIAHVRDLFATTKGVLEGTLGINLHTTYILGEDYPFDIYVTYEDELWFSQNQIMRFMGDTTDDGKFIHEKGDLGFHGVVFGMQFSF